MNITVKMVGPAHLYPTYANPGDAGADLRSAEDVVIGAHSHKLVKTGIKLEIPEGVVGLVHPRSGLALNYGITVLNAPGTIDSGYRGEIGVILYNTSHEVFQVNKGDRIAQLVFQKFDTADFVAVDSVEDTERGAGGFGSSGVE